MKDCGHLALPPIAVASPIGSGQSTERVSRVALCRPAGLDLGAVLRRYRVICVGIG